MTRFVVPSVALLFFAAPALAVRIPPKPVTPVVLNGIRYSAEGNGIDQYVLAVDASTCDPLWRTRIFHNNIWKWLEGDVQWVFITNLQPAGNSLRVTDEKFRRYSVDLATTRVEKLWFWGLFARAIDFEPKAASQSAAALCPAGPRWVYDTPEQPERTLAGIAINRTTLADLRNRIPASASRKTYGPAGAVSSIAWEEVGSRIYVSFTGQIVRAVSVRGKASSMRTARGLALGQSGAGLERMYRSFLWHEPTNCFAVSWNDGTELRAYASAADQITAIELIANLQ